MAAALKETLNIKEAVLEPRDTLTTPSMSAAELHRFVEKLKFAFAQRSEIRRENFGPHEQKKLFSQIKENFYKKFKRDSVLPTYADYGGRYPMLYDFVGTHLLIRDPHDNAISITASLNTEFGSIELLHPGVFFVNNYIAALFRYDMGLNPWPKLPPNHVLKLGRPAFTSMVPTIIARKDGNVNKLIAVLGSTGGLDSISTLAQSGDPGSWLETFDKGVKLHQVEVKLRHVDFSSENTATSSFENSKC
ncbi:uncharacterized protein LOC125941264 [Dermacentor silvarum]|uniref:uncharacterized protein LOC125941264 n=1 Tax=Dermacentor silvarum TaxID=543639 RepID=UPI0021015424|nr:uncharacterized protein LOC125941264 [Dermacentor silvarum]